MKYFNAHCHKFIPNNDVVGAVVNASQETDWQSIIQLQSEIVFGAIGIHPWYVKKVCDGWETRLRDALLDNKDLMVGEIGLDNLHDNTELQESVFNVQLKIANELKRPVNIHCVHAWNRVLYILKQYPDIPVIVFHSFNGNSDIMKQLSDNAYFSYGMEILKKDTGKSRERIIATPNNRILVETDNTEPDNLRLIVEKIAEIKKLTNEKMSDIILNNSHRFVLNG